MRKKTFYGVTVGILTVKTHFRRFPGDIGHAGTWPFPVQYRIVEEAVPATVTNIHEASLLEPFRKAALELVAAGVDGITTTCGFLSLYQRELAETCGVPVATSSLLQVPMVQQLIPRDRQVGVMTYDAKALAGGYLDAVGIDPATPVVGMSPVSEFVRSIRTGDDTVPYEVLRREVLDTAQRFVGENPRIGALVLECTNLAPFSADIAEALDCPVFDAVSLVTWFHAGLRPRRYPTER